MQFVIKSCLVVFLSDWKLFHVSFVETDRRTFAAFEQVPKV